ncbi:hypothetical protein FH972_023659 [Carpinus fangiana]|uniref:Uncharacterized protein n=1 Tax=Carpinus fangiana TaxID=176857 RepID=A0A5N6KY31_9ROSI|nr:hypothetical protein FH972_023659 [Carpinus fangiana]
MTPPLNPKLIPPRGCTHLERPRQKRPGQWKWIEMPLYGCLYIIPPDRLSAGASSFSLPCMIQK